MLYINPDTCVNCDACVPSCPVEAIFAEENLPANYQHFLQINSDGAKTAAILNQKKEPLEGAKPLDELKKLDAQGYVPPNFP